MTQTVVVVESNQLLARMYKAMLEPLHCRVLLAGTGEDARRIIGQGTTPRGAKAAPPETAPPADRAEVGSSRSGAHGAQEADTSPLFIASAGSAGEQAIRALGRAVKAIVVSKPIRGDELAMAVRRHLGRPG